MLVNADLFTCFEPFVFWSPRIDRVISRFRLLSLNGRMENTRLRSSYCFFFDLGKFLVYLKYTNDS